MASSAVAAVEPREPSGKVGSSGKLPANPWNRFSHLMTGYKGSKSELSDAYAAAKSGDWDRFIARARKLQVGADQARRAYDHAYPLAALADDSSIDGRRRRTTAPGSTKRVSFQAGAVTQSTEPVRDERPNYASAVVQPVRCIPSSPVRDAHATIDRHPQATSAVVPPPPLPVRDVHPIAAANVGSGSSPRTGAEQFEIGSDRSDDSWIVAPEIPWPVFADRPTRMSPIS